MAGGLALVALLASPGQAGIGDQQPDLSPPSESTSTIISKPATPPTAVPPARVPAPATGGRAMLAIPGLTTPTARPSIPLEGPKPVVAPAPDELGLDAPLEMKPLVDSSRSEPGQAPSRAGRPLVLESSSMDDPAAPAGPSTRSTPPARRPTTPAQPAPAPARRPRLFGFLGGPAAAPPPASSRAATPGRSVAADDFREDPAAESALKRRIERQAREVVGNRARSVEVKLDGKQASVLVSGVKFLQKRAVRKQLEGLPALSGLRSTIEVGD
jgi:hypothetical protein